MPETETVETNPSKAEISLSLYVQAEEKLSVALKRNEDQIAIEQRALQQSQQKLQALRDEQIALNAQRALINEVKLRTDEYIGKYHAQNA